MTAAVHTPPARSTAGPPQQWTTETGALALLLARLRLSLVEETVYDDLEAVLGEYAAPSPAEQMVLRARLREALEQLVRTVPQVVTPYPVEELQRALDLSTGDVPAEQAQGHLRRFALAVLELLQLMGDETP